MGMMRLPVKKKKETKQAEFNGCIWEPELVLNLFLGEDAYSHKIQQGTVSLLYIVFAAWHGVIMLPWFFTLLLHTSWV